MTRYQFCSHVLNASFPSHWDFREQSALTLPADTTSKSWFIVYLMGILNGQGTTPWAQSGILLHRFPSLLETRKMWGASANMLETDKYEIFMLTAIVYITIAGFKGPLLTCKSLHYTWIELCSGFERYPLMVRTPRRFPRRQQNGEVSRQASLSGWNGHEIFKIYGVVRTEYILPILYLFLPHQQKQLISQCIRSTTYVVLRLLCRGTCSTWHFSNPSSPLPYHTAFRPSGSCRPTYT